MATTVPHIDSSASRKNPDLAIPYLAHHLREGSLGLALGAGASQYLKLPDWVELVNRCSTGFPALRTKCTTKELCDRVEEIEIKHSTGGKADKGKSLKFRKLVHEALYKGLDYGNILHGELLMSLGALMIGSRRGKVTEVLNFNFDDVLAWYLHLHGYDINIVTNLPALRTAADVTIYHPHGFLPYNSRFDWSDFLIFSQQSYDAKMGDLVEPWSELTRFFMKSKVVLFVGLSGDDPTFGPIFSNVQTSLGTSRPTGVWLFTKSASAKKLNSLQSRKFVPLELDNHDVWPQFLLKICQAAADP